MEERKAYLTIGCARKMDIRVIWDDVNILYEGKVEDAPAEIKRLRYTKMDNKDKMEFYVYSEFNQF